MSETKNIIVKSLDDRWKNYRARLKTCRREFSEDAVHDLRVATRRLLAALDIARMLDSHPRIRKSRRSLKSQLDNLSELRDAQVMLLDIHKTLESLPELKLFELHLQEREKSLLRSARREVKNSKPFELGRRIEKIHARLKNQHRGAEFNARLFQAVDDAYLKVTQAYGQLDALQPETAHSLRIAFKKFRYRVEVIHPILPEYPETYLKSMHDYQNAMGYIQDAKICLDALKDFAKLNSFPHAQPARQFYEKHRTDLIAKYFENKGEINIFWRGASDQPFPWEKKPESTHHSTRHRRISRNAKVRRGQPTSAE